MLQVNLQLSAIKAVEKACDELNALLCVSKQGEVLIYSRCLEYGVIIGNHLNPRVSNHNNSLSKAICSLFYKNKKLPIELDFKDWELAFKQTLQPNENNIALPIEEVENAILTFKWLQDHC